MQEDLGEDYESGLGDAFQGNMFDDELYLLENWADVEEIDAGESEEQGEEHESEEHEQPAADILQSLEDRQSMHVDLHKYLGEEAKSQEQSASDVADLQAELKDEMNYSEERHACGSFRSLVPTKKLECFDESIPFFCSAAACHQRAEHLMPKMKQFVERVRVAEGLLSGTQRVLCLNMP